MALKKPSPRTLQILKLCMAPQRYVDLKKETRLSDAGLYKKLRELTGKGWLKKLPDGRYILTEEGLKFLEELEVRELLEEVLREYRIKAIKAELELMLRLDQLERRTSLRNLYLATRLLWRLALGFTEDPQLRTRAEELAQTVEKYVKSVLDTQLPQMRDPEYLKRLLTLKVRAAIAPEEAVNEVATIAEMLKMKSAVEARRELKTERERLLKGVTRLLSGVKTEALTGAEIRLALEVSSLFEEVRKRLEG